jgi:hypothetical protein
MRAKRVTALLTGTLLFVTACHKRSPVAASASPPVAAVPEPPAVAVPPSPVVLLPHPSVVVPPPSAPSPSLVVLEQADRWFKAGVYDESAQAYEKYLRLQPTGCPCEQELLRLALSYVLRRSPRPDWQRATSVLKQLVDEYPNSSFTASASLILILRSQLDHLALDTAVSTKQRDEQIRQLSSELDRLKKIDSDRMKRP